MRPAVPSSRTVRAVPPPKGRAAEESHELRQQRLLRNAGNISFGVVLSGLLHLILILIFQIWMIVTKPGAEGFVIECQILTGDEGAESPDNTILQAPVADETPAGPEETEELPEEVLEEDLPVAAGGAGDPMPPANRGGGAGGGGSGGTGGGGVGFFGTKAGGGSFVFIVDRSGSMQSENRFDIARRELTRAIAQLDDDQAFYVIFYSGHLALPPLPGPTELLPATDAMKIRVKNWYMTLSADGSTEPEEAVKLALSLEPDVVFLLTDGEIPPETQQAARAFNSHGAAIHTTSLQSREGEAILQQIASDSGGTYRYIERIVSPSEELTKEERLANQAASKLHLAKKFLEQGRRDAAKRWLTSVVNQFPTTPQAAEAKTLLSTL